MPKKRSFEEYEINVKNNNNLDDKKEEQYFMKDLYVFSSIEPCFMCSMALIHSRVNRLYFFNQN